MAIQANMHEAKSNLSQLADRAAEGETVIIAKAGKPCTVGRHPGRSAPPRCRQRQVHRAGGFQRGDAVIAALFEGDE